MKFKETREKEYHTAREILVDYELGFLTKKQALQKGHLYGLDVAKHLED